MLQKVEISDPGDSAFIAGEQLDKLEAEEINEKLISKKQQPMVYKPILLGITKALFKQDLLFLQHLSKKLQEF